MKPMRERITEYSKGDNLDLFWRLFRLRERSGSRLVTGLLTLVLSQGSRLVTGLLTLVLSRMARRHGGYVGKTAVIEGFLSLPHGLHGVYISRYARIGSGCRIYQNVTIGEVEGKAPQIGRNCLIGAGAVVVGGIRIGDGVKIGAGAVVHTDVPAGSTVVAPPPRIIRRE